MPVNVEITAGLDDDFSGLLEDANGNAIAITAGSDVLFKAYRGGNATPDLDLNGTPLAGGSKTTFTPGSGAGIGTWNVTIHGSDTSALIPGAYDIKVELVDAGDSNRLKSVDFGVLYVLAGTAGKTT